MTRAIQLSEEELALLDQIITAEVSTTHNELRRTRNPEFRDEVKHRVELAEHVLEEIHRAREGSEPEMGEWPEDTSQEM